MALTLNNFTGFETQGEEEASASGGSPSFETASPLSGSSSLSFNASTDTYTLPWTAGVTDAGSGYIIGFRLDVALASGTNDVLEVLDDSGGVILTATVLTSGRLRLLDAAGGTLIFASDTVQNKFVEIYAQLNNSSADWEMFFDGVSQGSGSGADLTDGNAFGSSSELKLSGVSTNTLLFDDIYILSGATSASDRYGDFAVKAYQNTAEDATDQGDTLADGTWALVSETPGNLGTSNDAQYRDTGNLTGSTIMDEGDRPGPSGDSDVTGATIKGAKFLGTYMRSTGGGRTHSMLTGSDETVSGFPQATTTIVLTTDYVVHERLVAAGVVEVPTTADFFQMGFSKSATAGQDIFCGDQWCMLGYVPAAVAANPIPSLVMAPYIPA